MPARRSRSPEATAEGTEAAGVRFIDAVDVRRVKAGKIVRDQGRLNVSLRLKQKPSKRVRVVRGGAEPTASSTAAKGLDL